MGGGLRGEGTEGGRERDRGVVGEMGKTVKEKSGGREEVI